MARVLAARAALAMSAAISVKAQKNGGLLHHPMGRQRGRPMRLVVSVNPERMTANSKTASGMSLMR